MKSVAKEKFQLFYPDAVIFDWDNTLVNSHEAITMAFNKLLAHYNMPQITLEQAKNSPQMSLKDSFPLKFGEEWEKARDIYSGHFKEIHLETLKPFKGAHELLDYLKFLNLPLFIVSNKTYEHLEAEIKALQWDAHFQVIRGSIDGRVDKPNPAAVHQALENSGLHPETHTIWFIGDSPIDAECALNSGCTPLIIQEKKNISNFKYSQEDIVFIDSLLAVKELLAYFK